MSLLQLDDLRVSYRAENGLVHAVNGVSLTLDAGQKIGIVGESGSGKSTLAMAIPNLLPGSGQSEVAGNIWFDGKNLAELDEAAMRRRRGRDIAVVFQDPLASLNPVLTIGEQVAEAIRAHRSVSWPAAKQEAAHWLAEVGLADARNALRRYPHELSGGMRQRVMIAAAIALAPRLVIADEPTTALDLTTQAQVLDLLERLVEQHGAALILITHDFGVIGEMVDEVMVMYAGEVVDRAPTAELFARQRHPYTRALMHAMPSEARLGDDLDTLPGAPPDMSNPPEACAFAPRCDRRTGRCERTKPLLHEVSADGHMVACHHPYGGATP